MGIDNIQDFVKNMNAKKREILKGYSANHIHHTTDGKLIRKIRLNMYKTYRTRHKTTSSSLDIGEYVRVSKTSRTQQVFNKGFIEQNSREVFTIYKIDRNSFPTTFYLRDLDNKKIQGKFYSHELIQTDKPSDFRIEILGK